MVPALCCCKASKLPTARVTSETHRPVPLIVADYAFVRDHEDKELAKLLVVKVEPSNLLLCIVVDQKGNDETTISTRSSFQGDRLQPHGIPV